MSGKIPDQPFGRIALCCSGGGYRAASFHLGAMSYLQKLSFEGRPLVENVKAISTVSGGTITGVIYALQKQQGKSFDEIYDFIVDKLRSLDLVRLGLAKLNEGAEWTNPYKRKNLINAFAEIYDAEFTDGETFDIFENMDRSHLEEVMFNATEFRTGVIFRFQSGGRFGNFHQSAKKSIWGEVKLADVIAASSCFTGGFEPIEWPRDFVHSEALNLAEEAPLMYSAGLMDGGIYDNQGLDSILLSENRVAGEPYDLIIASDVTSPYMNPFKFLDDKGDKGWRKWNYAGVRSRIIKWYRRIKWVLLILLLISGMYLLMNWSDSLATGIFLSIGLLAVILLLLMSRIKKKIRIYLSDAKEYLEKELADDIPIEDLKSLEFSEIPFKNLEPLIVDRIRSLITLVGEVFLKTVRRLVYGRLYASETHQFRRMSNLIRELTREDFEVKRARERNEPDYFQNIPGCDPILIGTYDEVIGAKLQLVAETATSFGTTLWFTKTEKLADILNTLIICGQATMCFNLLRYLVELRGTPDNGYHQLAPEKRAAIDHLWDQCLEDWKTFKEDPGFMIRRV